MIRSTKMMLAEVQLKKKEDETDEYCLVMTYDVPDLIQPIGDDGQIERVTCGIAHVITEFKVTRRSRIKHII